MNHVQHNWARKSVLSHQKIFDPMKLRSRHDFAWLILLDNKNLRTRPVFRKKKGIASSRMGVHLVGVKSIVLNLGRVVVEKIFSFKLPF